MYRYNPVQHPVNQFTWNHDGDNFYGHAETKASLQTIKVGDKVWVGDSQFPCKDGIKTVSRLTDTLIIVDKGSEYERFDRLKYGYQKRGGMFKSSITGIATPAEVTAYEKEQARKKAEQDERDRKRAAREAKQKELNALFEGRKLYVVPDHDDDGKPQTWTVHVHNLTESEVRGMASLVAAASLFKEGK
jgi:hypothetical protein